MQATRLISSGYVMYWRIVRFRGWLMLLGIVIIGAALGSTEGAD